ncbi:MAG: signal peptidase I [Siculibacillus sp.]|nr:signal peptidase I [Siculibacillus sp.]
MSETTEPKHGDSGLVETIKVIVQALLLALVVRTFFYQPFNIPSGSMKSTLLVGDYLFVSKFSYGYSKYSLPYAAIPFSGRIFGSEPQRGDVAVFKLPRDNETDYIKRVIGLPGDRIQVKRGLLHINGEAVKLEPLEPFVETDRWGARARLRAFKETLPNGVSHTILKRDEDGFYNNTQEYVVPAGHYFMMGDNRDNSQDSRWLDMVGYVPAENLIGKAQVIFFSIEEGATPWAFWTWPWEIRWGRLANLI